MGVLTLLQRQCERSACARPMFAASYLLVVATFTIAAAPARAATGPSSLGQWVALGDSYSSGEGTGATNNNSIFDPDTNRHDAHDYIKHGPGSLESINTSYPFNECRRSPDAYARLLDFGSTPGGDLHAEPFELVHRACSGAVIENVVAPSDGTDGRQGFTIHLHRKLAPGAADCTTTPQPVCKDFHWRFQDYQIRYLTPQTKLVTISIGGNDVGFADIVEGCIVASVGHDHRFIARILRRFRLPAAARNFLRSKSHTCQDGMALLADLAPDRVRDPAPLIAGMTKRLVAVYNQILTKAPKAKLLVVGYPNIVALAGETKDSLALCPILRADRVWVAKVVADVNVRISEAVSTTARRYPNRVFFVDESHAFDEHELCNTAAHKGELFENGVVDPIGGAVAAIRPAHVSRSNNSFHPTIAGYCAIAKQVMLTVDRLFDVSAPAVSDASSPCAHRSKSTAWWKWALLGGGVTLGIDRAARAFWRRLRANRLRTAFAA